MRRVSRSGPDIVGHDQLFRFPHGVKLLPTSIARVSTDRADRYIKQLVSQMSHKVSTETRDDGSSVITVQSGHCTLRPESDHILMTAVATDAELLARVEDVIGRHLVRFGTKDELTVSWEPESD
jgi:caffeoyl-CoA O-methyltransferase